VTSGGQAALRPARFPRVAERASRRRGPHRVRDVVVAVASVGVLGLLVLYAIAAPGVSLSTNVGSVVPLPGRTAVVVGRVLGSDGGGLKGARVDVRVGPRTTGSALTNAGGAFRVKLLGRCALYTVLIRASTQGSNPTATVRRRLCPGDALPVDARVVTQGQFLWIPGPR
jgi:hypothetical protein